MADQNRKPSCAGTRKSWPWTGYPCGAKPVLEKDGKHYCKNHYPVERKERSNG